MTIEIVPSVLPVDHAELGEECRRLADAGVDRIQWDVMDGVFVPNLTFGPDVIRACRKVVDTPFEAHLMIQHPERSLEQYADAGCEWLIVHAESTPHPHRALMAARGLSAKAGLALNPGTPFAVAEPMLDEIDMLLIMTVNPGFGGQSYLPAMQRKVEQARQRVDDLGLAIDIEVDGGINLETIGGAAAAGANLFVSGSGLWNADDLGEQVRQLRSAASAQR